MIESEIFAQQLTAARTKLSEIAKALDIEHLKEQLVELPGRYGLQRLLGRHGARRRTSPPKAHRVEVKLNHYKSLAEPHRTTWR